MTTQNTDITRSDTDNDSGGSAGKYGILTRFQKAITDLINSGQIQFNPADTPDDTSPTSGSTRAAVNKSASDSASGVALGGNPFRSGAPISGSLSSTNYGSGVPLNATQTATSTPNEVDVPAGDITATTLVSVFQNAAQLLSRVRRYSLVKSYNNFGSPVVQLRLGESAAIFAVNPGGDTWTVTGNFTVSPRSNNFTVGSTFTVEGNADSTANKQYTVVTRTLSGGNTILEVSPGAIPVGATASGTAHPDRYGHLTSAYQKAAGTFTVSLSLGTDVGATALDAVVATVSGEIKTHRNTVVAFTESWCHSSCHSSHSSRGRR